MERNPLRPDYTGLDLVLSQSIGESGTAQTKHFREWVSSRQRGRAQILKQSRLLREEDKSSSKEPHTQGKQKDKPPKPKGEGKGKEKGADG